MAFSSGIVQKILMPPSRGVAVGMIRQGVGPPGHWVGAIWSRPALFAKQTHPFAIAAP